MHQSLKWFNLWEVPSFFGVLMYAFEGNSIIINIQNGMQKPHQIYFAMTFTSTLFAISIALFSSVCYYVSTVSAAALFHFLVVLWRKYRGHRATKSALHPTVNYYKTKLLRSDVGRFLL